MKPSGPDADVDDAVDADVVLESAVLVFRKGSETVKLFADTRGDESVELFEHGERQRLGQVWILVGKARNMPAAPIAAERIARKIFLGRKPKSRRGRRR